MGTFFRMARQNCVKMFSGVPWANVAFPVAIMVCEHVVRHLKEKHKQANAYDVPKGEYCNVNKRGLQRNRLHG